MPAQNTTAVARARSAQRVVMLHCVVHSVRRCESRAEAVLSDGDWGKTA
jgi:hypothetical protein